MACFHLFFLSFFWHAIKLNNYFIMQLLRMVSDEHGTDGSQLSQATFTHAMELKPYIEEPISKDAISLCFRPLDLRPRIRHDFVLSSRKVVDEYWQTLEYCYAAADSRAALHAFPGSAVHEVCTKATFFFLFKCITELLTCILGSFCSCSSKPTGALKLCPIASGYSFNISFP